jgi:hypothetical protein
VSIEGSLEEFRLPDVLQMVARQRKTGILTVQSDTTIVAVSFLGGDVVSADSLAQTVEDRLGEVLVREGLLDRSKFAALAARQEAGEGRLLDLLVRAGGVTREQVLACLRLQTGELVGELLDWRQGEFKFYGGDEVSHEEGIEPLAVADLVAGSETVPPPEPPEPVETTAPIPPQPFAEPAPLPRPAPIVVEMPLPEPEVDEEPAAAAQLPPSAAPVLASVLAACLLVAVRVAPVSFLLPFPWQAQDRRALLEVQRLADHLAVDRAAKTYFLLEGRFPDSLDRLVELDLLDPEDLVDPQGRRLLLDPRADSYEVRPRGEGGLEEARTEAITGNFLLDPDFLDVPGGVETEAPLVLLD